MTRPSSENDSPEKNSPPPFVASLHTAQVETFPWGELRWLCSDRLSPGAQQTFGHCRIAPQTVNPLHFHPNCEELLYLLSGAGEHRFGDDWIPLSAGALIRIPAGVRHCLRNTGDTPLECLISFSSGVRETIFLE